ncbi:hypothetical protein [Criblamydia sequanensis]|uniref:Uncharacterized protein n=1 Tax=Candidatus Criblamydia sequanensis CRIB-18 TaxID=1437425 RepID=A0A090E396_9BACT|nr:hypothetical protein [Criblamydia sequanensis]CDR35079.1 Conserved hypothetical protein [Criblamydia sequanensis CRIB-18]
MLKPRFPTIQTVFDPKFEGSRNLLYVSAIEQSLKKLLPESFFEMSEEETFLDKKDYFFSMLPLVKTLRCEDNPQNFSFFMLSRYRANAFKFFFEIISMWLVPGKRLDVGMIFAADFCIQEFGEDVYTICEIVIPITNASDLVEIESNLPIIEMEASLGVESSFFAARILEVKGISVDEKTVLIQDRIRNLIRRNEPLIGRDIMTEMQHLLVISDNAFKAHRKSFHLTKIITSQYIFRKELLESVRENPQKRFLKLKIFQTTIQGEDGLFSRNILSVLVGVNFLKDKEFFEEQHLLTVIQNYMPGVKAVDGSFIANKRGNEKICTAYLEVEKIEGGTFKILEMKHLKQGLFVDLKDRIAHLMHPVFMPRNEEEVMRNVLTISSQMRYLQDLPQVFISFDEQTHSDLVFTIIFVRVVKPGSLSLQEQFNESNSFLQYVHDRCKTVGMIRKKFVKEATVFRLKIKSADFLRLDHTIDLNKARQAVVEEMTRVLGEFRDYNGGMISKQNELLLTLRNLLKSESVKYSELLLENFFYSLTPVIMRTVLEPKSLKKLFMMLLNAISGEFFKERHSHLIVEEDEQFVYAIISAENPQAKKIITKVLQGFNRHPGSLAETFVQVYDSSFLGYIFRSDDKEQRQLFVHFLNEGLQRREEELEPSERNEKSFFVKPPHPSFGLDQVTSEK